uniref:Large ribosomal subunit protein mL53 n=1 Tax=Taeniopygia guttata TaxID=59729 RepID=H0ZN39_TAEGU
MASKVSLVLRPVKNIVVRFCPFEPNVESTRKFLQSIYHKKVQATNTNCEITTDVRHDGSEPVVDVTFADGDRLIMKGARTEKQEEESLKNGKTTVFASTCVRSSRLHRRLFPMQQNLRDGQRTLNVPCLPLKENILDQQIF